MARKVSAILLSILGLFLIGVVIVLSSVKHYLYIQPWAYITELEVPPSAGAVNATSDSLATFEKIPRILHQTWKSETLPERWRAPSLHCREMMPDYEYMLWTDAKSRELIAEKYPWFLETYDGYKFNIQRADAIRYFVLHQYGGVYLDLDVGCVRNVDPLLQFEVILPRTIPVGVSNDIMFSAKGHPFMEQAIHQLITFDINWLLNYPTVMFSTGPMFISVQYGLYMASHPPTPQNPGGEVRVLPKSLYGKNAKPEEAPHTFFEHFYGSSWHSDDAFLWTFLGVWGIRLMWVALAFLIVAGAKMYLNKRKGYGSGRRRVMFGRYEVILPRFHQDRADTTLDLGPFALWTSNGTTSGVSTPSASSSEPGSPIFAPILPFDITPASPTLSSGSSSSDSSAYIAGAFRKAGAWLGHLPAMVPSLGEAPRRSRGSRRRSGRNYMFFLPAIFTPSSSPDRPRRRDADGILLANVHADSQPRSRSRPPSPTLNEKAREAGIELYPHQNQGLAATSANSLRRSSSAIRLSESHASPRTQAPPPYPETQPQRPASPKGAGDWESWPSSASR